MAHQLALYVVIYSPIQMACDLPEHYMKDGKIHPAFQFITDVGVDWETTKVLDAEIGDFVIIARKERTSSNWFVGGITDENAREATLDFGFLPEGKTFVAKIYKDAENADWDENPEAYSIDSMDITRTTQLKIKMALEVVLQSVFLRNKWNTTSIPFIRKPLRCYTTSPPRRAYWPVPSKPIITNAFGLGIASFADWQVYGLTTPF